MILFISSHPPFNQQHAKGLLDMVLAACAFEVPMAFLLQGAGVLQLMPQQAEVIEEKNVHKQLSALSLYGLQHIHVEQAALEKYGIDATQIDLPIEVLPPLQCQQLIASYPKVIRL
jgi:tRNA 2-thiouridine synthesizing protein C